MKWPAHGSNPQYLYEAVGHALPEKFIDFSANINPLGPPAVLAENWNRFHKEITVYPDPFAYKLKEAIAKKENISSESILMGNGGAELISLVARMLTGKKVVIVQPAFSEYETACRANHCDIIYHQLTEPGFELIPANLSSKLKDADALFLCNPNNPTGIQFPNSKVISIIEECEKRNCFIILDEAFYDFLAEYDSVISYINRFSKLIIIRSMTKMFAIPGIRLGYLVARQNIIQELSRFQSHWNINAIALLSGELCLQEKDFVTNTQEYIFTERQRLFEFFRTQELTRSASVVNFYLLRDPSLTDQYPLFEFLLSKGIVPRHTFNFPGLEGRWLRFAIKSSEENDLLMEVLTDWRQHRN